MSKISKLVDSLREEAMSMGAYGTSYMSTLLKKSADTIEMLSEKVRETKQEWIPCSERLPEEEVSVLVQYGDRSISVIDSARPNLWKDITVIDCQIVAWMPLPEPWEGAGDD